MKGWAQKDSPLLLQIEIHFNSCHLNDISILQPIFPGDNLSTYSQLFSARSTDKVTLFAPVHKSRKFGSKKPLQSDLRTAFFSNGGHPLCEIVLFLVGPPPQGW